MPTFRKHTQTTDVDPDDLETDAAWDWVGLIVEAQLEFRNGLGSLPAGSLYVVQRSWGGLDLKSEPCDGCGISFFISDVARESHSVEPVMRYARCEHPDSLRIDDLRELPWQEARERLEETEDD